MTHHHYTGLYDIPRDVADEIMEGQTRRGAWRRGGWGRGLGQGGRVGGRARARDHRSGSRDMDGAIERSRDRNNNMKKSKFGNSNTGT